MEKKIRVLHISKYYPPYIGGLESFCHDIVSALRKEGGYEQYVFCFNDKDETVEEEFDGVKVYRIGIQRIVASQPLAKGYGKALKKAIAEFKPDIVHFLYPNPYAAFFFLKCKFDGKLHLDWVFDITKQKTLKKLFKHQTETLLKRAAMVTSIAPTYFEGTDYLPFYKGEKGCIPCRIGDNRLNVTKEQISKANVIKEKYPGKKLVFFYGRHTEYKGLKYLIESNRYLDQENTEILIAGQGDQTEELKKQASEYRNIEFLGKLSDEDINAYLMACDVFAFPSISRNEAFGIALAEAMHFGKPACTFTISGSGVNWVCPNNVAGLETPNKDVKAYADNINRLLNDKELYDRLSKGAIDRCGELFMKDSFDKNVIEVYKRIAAVKEPSEHRHEQISKNYQKTENQHS